jgi:Protein kinase domain
MDYGLATVNTSSSLTAVSPDIGNTGWIAPEMIKPVHSQAPVESKPADIFAFGILAVGVYTGEPPFDGQESGTKIALRILEGERPRFPQNPEAVGFTPQIKAIIQDCWRVDPAERLTVEEVVANLEALGDNEYVQGKPNNQNRGEFVADADVLFSDPRPMPPTPGQPPAPYEKEHLQGGPTEQGAQRSGTDTGGPSTMSMTITKPQPSASTSSSSDLPTCSLPTKPSSQSETTLGNMSYGLRTRSTPGSEPQPQTEPRPQADGMTDSKDCLPGPGRKPPNLSKPLSFSMNIVSSST